MNMKKGMRSNPQKTRGEGEVFRAVKRHPSATFQEEMHVTGNTGS